MTKLEESGSGYGREAPRPDERMTPVGPGTPAGNLFRRYWQPVGVASELSDLPKAVRVLGEDLIVFRDGEGRFGLRCARCHGHPSTTRRVRPRIRCCCHGS
jgi:phenylpropionate dioxygenase-like ring-hydroxylating dioxygenase large terminal subunit